MKEKIAGKKEKKPEKKKMTSEEKRLHSFYETIDNLTDKNYRQSLENPKTGISPFYIIGMLELLKLEFYRRHDKFLDNLDDERITFEEYRKRMRKEKKVNK